MARKKKVKAEDLEIKYPEEIGTILQNMFDNLPDPICVDDPEENELEIINFKEAFDNVKIANIIEGNINTIKARFGRVIKNGYLLLEKDLEVTDKDVKMLFIESFMNTSAYCHHIGNYDFTGKTFDVVRDIKTTLEEYLTKTSEMLVRMNYDSLNPDYVYEYLEDSYYLSNIK